MNAPEKLEQIRRFAHRGCESELQPEEAAQLEALLLDDPVAQRAWMLLLEQDLQLSWLTSSGVMAVPEEEHDEEPGVSNVEEVALPVLSEVDGTAVSKVEGPTPPLVPPSPRPTVPSSRSPVLGFLAGISRHVPGGEFTVGSLLLLVIVAAFWGLSQAILYPRSGGHDLAQESSPRPSTVATIRETSDVEWSEVSVSRLTDSSTSRDATISANQPLSIQSGLIELQLKQGTTLFIEGPADWQINGENSATLTRGKLVAKVPQQAIGFTLETPTARIVDLGTEFGVEVNDQGLSEVQVEKGQVEVRTSSPGKTVLSTGQAVRIDAKSVQTINADSKRFSKLASALAAESQPVRAKSWVESGLTVFTSLIDRFGTSNAWEKLADSNARQRRVLTSSSSHFPWAAYSPPKAIGFFALWDGSPDVVALPNLDMRAPGPQGIGAYTWTLFDSQGIGAVPDCAVANLHRIELTWLPLSTAKGKLRILIRDQQGHWFLSDQSLDVLTDGKVAALDVAATDWKAVSTKLVPLRGAPASLLTLGERAPPDFKRVTGVGIYWAESSDTVNHAARIGSIALIGAEDAKPAQESDIGTTPASPSKTSVSK